MALSSSNFFETQDNMWLQDELNLYGDEHYDIVKAEPGYGLTSSNFTFGAPQQESELPFNAPVQEDVEDASSMEVDQNAEPSSDSSSGSHKSIRRPAVSLKAHRHVDPSAPKIIRGPVDGQVKQSRSRNAAQQFRARQKERVGELEEKIQQLENLHAAIRNQSAALKKENADLALRQRFLRAFVFKAMTTAFPHPATYNAPSPVDNYDPNNQKAQKVY